MDNLFYEFMFAIPNTTLLSNETSCGLPPEISLHLVRDLDDPGTPWLGVLISLNISSIWYWCSDQVIVQRALAAKNYTHAKAGTLLAAYLKLLPMWLLVFPGMIARVLFPDEVGCGSPDQCLAICGKRRGCTDIAYPSLVLKLMPSGARGLMLSVMVASLVSSLTSIFNSASTIFTMDIWKRLRKSCTDMELMIVGRLFVLTMVAIGVAWIPVVKSGSELFHYIQAVTVYLAPPVFAVYLCAIFWKRCNEQGVFWGLMGGLVVGLIRFILEYINVPVACGEEHLDTTLDIVKKVHYLHFGILLFFISLSIIIIVSLLSKPIDDKHLPRLLFWNRFDQSDRIDLPDTTPGRFCSDFICCDKGDETAIESSNCDLGKENVAYVDSKDNEIGSSRKISTVSEIVDKQTKSPKEVHPPKWYKRIFFWVCGIESMVDEAEPIPKEELLRLEKESISLKENSFWKQVVDINAIILLAVAVFFCGFFA